MPLGIRFEFSLEILDFQFSVCNSRSGLLAGTENKNEEPTNRRSPSAQAQLQLCRAPVDAAILRSRRCRGHTSARPASRIPRSAPARRRPSQGATGAFANSCPRTQDRPRDGRQSQTLQMAFHSHGTRIQREACSSFQSPVVSRIFQLPVGGRHAHGSCDVSRGAAASAANADTATDAGRSTSSPMV